ncbi:hypothetical protein EDB87DRAFT_680278 [Lactarius vividus]|nr:hypothetical protein EDB87DRAFT_680278 [Lactarius vividus]
MIIHIQSNTSTSTLPERVPSCGVSWLYAIVSAPSSLVLDPSTRSLRVPALWRVSLFGLCAHLIWTCSLLGPLHARSLKKGVRLTNEESKDPAFTVNPNDVLAAVISHSVPSITLAMLLALGFWLSFWELSVCLRRSLLEVLLAFRCCWLQCKV